VGALLLAGACRRAPPPPPSIAPDPSASDAPPSTAGAVANAAPPREVSPEEAKRGDALAKQSDRCLRDLGCSAAEAARLYLAADDAGAAEVSCFRFYYGILVPADARRARACFERAVRREGACGDQSPTLDRLFLELMLLDGQGGPRDGPRGDALVAGCLWGGDSGVTAAVTQHAAGDSGAPLDFCADIGGSTLDMNGCAAIEETRAAVAAARDEKALVAELALDEAGLALWKRADAAFSTFAIDEMKYAGDVYRDGFVRVMQETYIQASHERDRVEVLRALLDHAPPPEGSAEELRQAEARAHAEPRDADNRKLLARAQASWKAYRAAELAFARRALGARYGGEAAVTRALDAELDHRRARALLDEVKARRGEP